MTFAACWFSPPVREPIPCRYPGSTRDTDLIRRASMVDVWLGRSTDTGESAATVRTNQTLKERMP